MQARFCFIAFLELSLKRAVAWHMATQLHISDLIEPHVLQCLSCAPHTAKSRSILGCQIWRPTTFAAAAEGCDRMLGPHPEVPMRVEAMGAVDDMTKALVGCPEWPLPGGAMLKASCTAPGEKWAALFL